MGRDEYAGLTRSSTGPEQAACRLHDPIVGCRPYSGDLLPVERNQYNTGRGCAGRVGVEGALGNKE